MNKQTFLLVGFDHLANENRDHFSMNKIFEGRGYNIHRHHENSSLGFNVRFISMHNHRTTVVTNIMNEHDRAQYGIDLPAIHFKEGLCEVREHDYVLNKDFNMSDFDKIVFGIIDKERKEAELKATTNNSYDEDDDYSPVVFGSNDYGYSHGYDEGLELLC